MNPSLTSMGANINLSSNDDPIPNAAKYKKVVRALQYHTLSCPDIVYAVNNLSHFIENPSSVH